MTEYFDDNYFRLPLRSLLLMSTFLLASLGFLKNIYKEKIDDFYLYITNFFIISSAILFYFSARKKSPYREELASTAEWFFIIALVGIFLLFVFTPVYHFFKDRKVIRKDIDKFDKFQKIRSDLLKRKDGEV
jgi:hypothetical protein